MSSAFNTKYSNYDSINLTIISIAGSFTRRIFCGIHKYDALCGIDLVDYPFIFIILYSMQPYRLEQFNFSSCPSVYTQRNKY